jgi:hypothetical protein
MNIGFERGILLGSLQARASTRMHSQSQSHSAEGARLTHPVYELCPSNDKMGRVTLRLPRRSQPEAEQCLFN